MLSSTSFGVTGDNRLDSLIISYLQADGALFDQGTKWSDGGGSDVVIEFSFPDATSTWAGGYGDGEPSDGFVGLNVTQQAAVRAALEFWSNVTNITFVEVDDDWLNPGGTLRFGFSDVVSGDTAAYAYLPFDEAFGPEGGDVWINKTYLFDSFAVDSFEFSVLVHEIGHALGLSHPHDDIPAASTYDWAGYSIMAYRTFEDSDLSSGANRFPFAPMIHDILAIQHMYGVNTTYNNTDTVYSWSVGEGILETIWDGGGTDLIDWSNQSTSAVINLMPGVWSQLGPSYSYWDASTSGSEARTLMIAYGTSIENANGGSAADEINGNPLNNDLKGFDGADSLDGQAGNDTIDGGLGNDYILGGDGTDFLVGGSGVDVLIGQRHNDTISGGADSDWIQGGGGRDSVNGDEGNDTIIGEHGQDTISGGPGADYIDGGIQKDTLSGDDGADEILGDRGSDSISGGLGNDTIDAGVGHDIVTGGPGNDTLQGNWGQDSLEGGDDADLLLGGPASDTLIGGEGDDWLNGGPGNDSIVGGNGDDWLFAEKGNDSLTGGNGADYLYGREGDDRFFFNTGDDADEIHTFAAGAASEDIIVLSVTGFTNFAEVQAVTSQSDGDTVINFGGGDQITLIGVVSTDLHEDDFLFV